jgi:hypothetical protein
MKFKFWLVTPACTLLLALAPTLGGAAPMAQIVHVDGCGASAGDPAQSFMGPFHSEITQPGLPAMAMIDFFNATNNEISSIEFGLVADGKLLAVVRDTGSFAPNARIMHAYGIDAAAVPPAGAQTECVPLRVRYANGSTWMNPSMPAH